MSSADIAGILENSKKLDRLKKQPEDVLSEINEMHKKLRATPEVVEKPGDAFLSRLKFLYTQAKDLSDREVSIFNLLIIQLDALLPTGPPAQPRRKIDSNEQKRKRMKNDPDASKLSPSMRNPLEMYGSLKGQQVAARINAEDVDQDEWFIVKVTKFDRETKERVMGTNGAIDISEDCTFEVLDEESGDNEEGTGQKKYKVPVSHIIPFPKQNDPWSAQDFPPTTHVLAVYPGTTALYRATVVNSHRKRKTDNCLLEFDGDEEDGAMPQRTVPYYKVVPLPE